jgi:RNA 2',3'-cyclic 3'-phosphodiesterase
MARLFFAAWPSHATQQALGKLAQELQRECGGRAVPAHNIHLTLVFLGDIARERVAAFETLADTVATGSFELRIDQAAFWHHNRIVWAGVSHCPAALPALVEQLEQRLALEGLRFDERPYVPHITLLRHARRAPANFELPAVAWPVSCFALMESAPRGAGRAYEVLREWPLMP